MATKKGKSELSEKPEEIFFNGQRLELLHHETDFSVLAQSTALNDLGAEDIHPITPNMTRVRATSPSKRDSMMSSVRKQNVAHHIYTLKETNEELIIDDKVILELNHEGTGELEQIIDKFSLDYIRRMGSAHILRVTAATGMNPVKVSQNISTYPEVKECSPQLILDIQFHSQPVLFSEQWYLTTDLISHPDITFGIDINVPEAWQHTMGDPEIVIAVIDDGFDLGHPVFGSTRIHPDLRDFMGVDADPTPERRNYHGTPVASIAIGSQSNGVMRGIASNCTFLPIRIGFGSGTSHINMLEVFEYVSERADVVNCSFGMPPMSFDRMHNQLRASITELTNTGGRRKKGLVMVFSASNDDAPTFLEGSKNKNGVKFTRKDQFSGTFISEIPKNSSVFSGYPMTEGVIVVSSIASTGRKSGYSCWGPHITVGAPSNNMHYIMEFVEPGSDPRREQFVANFRGLGQVAGANRPGEGHAFSPIDRNDLPFTPDLPENLYTKEFGGTSGAAPVVAGVAGLILSANPDLTAAQVKNILMTTADRDLDPDLDLEDDPNIQGLSGAFKGNRSLFFGSGKVNAARAVSRAAALRTGGPQISTETPVAAHNSSDALLDLLSFEEIERIKYELWSGDVHQELMAAIQQKKLVAEGDSWFDYLPGLDVLDQLKRNHGYSIFKVANAGDTIENMAYSTEIRDNFSRRPPQIWETLDAIRRHSPRVVLLSGGGNDIAGKELDAFLNHHDSGLPIFRRDYAQSVLETAFREAYRYILRQIWNIDSTIHVIGHGYGHAIPDGRAVRILGIKFAGPWLRPAFARKNILDPVDSRDVIREMINMVNNMLSDLQASHPNFHYLDLRPHIADRDWVNELHLSNSAFGKVADQFALEIQKYM